MPIRRKGLTLIEILIIVVMIGILVTIVIQKVGGKKNKEVIAALQTNVRNARVAETRYFGDHNMYGSLAQLDSTRLFAPIPGTTVAITVTATGYVATASSSTDPIVCTMTVAGGETAAAGAQVVCK